MSDTPAAGLLVDPNKPLTFTFEGRRVAGFVGQSIAAALYAAGVRVFSRSFKYHRPRGLFCVSGECPNCLMNVDGRPNVRACTEPACEGQTVARQNAWPSADFDALRVFDKLDRFLPVGFYYKRFHKPRWLWPVFEHTVRHVAGLGRIDLHAVPDGEAQVKHVHAEVCVIGGGPAGLAAAVAAQDAGAEVVLLEREPRLGGHLLEDGQTHPMLGEVERPDRAGRLEIRCPASAFGIYEGNLVGAFQGDCLLKVRTRQMVVCTGGRQQPALFHNNDLPGVMLGRGALRLARLYGVRAGRRAVILTDCDDGEHLASQLHVLGIEVAAVIDQRSGSAVVAGVGNKRLRAVRTARLKSDGCLEPGSGQEIACDLLCLAPSLVPANELLLQAGVRYRHEAGRWLLDRVVPGVHAAGAVVGTMDLEAQIAEGRAAGAQAAALAKGQPPPPPGSSALAPVASPLAPRSSPLVLGGKRFVCLCEDVTEKDVVQAISEGFDHIETLKRYTTAGMGPCQGKMCGLTATTLCARLTGRDASAVGTTTSRPPAVPVEMCVLAAERRHQPVRRTPLHHWHEQAGARWMYAGLWKRPESYGDSVGEVRAVRSAVGLIDVSTLGKIEVVGPDAAELLDRVYLNRWSDLKPGRARYGALCTEEGILFDDGVGARLGPERFYLTATTGNADAVVQWLELWRDTWKLNATVLSHTVGVAAMNLAGPLSRAVLARLTDLDLSAAAFPYMAMREGTIAGVSCRLFRIGFVGELGYEIHCPASHAWQLWEALHDAGKEHGLRPFGVEAQRVLRLEKGHLILGVDTDALSNPLDAGLGWLVRFDKPDFIGRAPLLRLKAMGPRTRLIGFTLPDGRLPEEGCQVVERGAPVGRVTSARPSPTLGRTIGLAWVPAARSNVGDRFSIRCHGRDVEAVVAALPFYDPEGKRMQLPDSPPSEPPAISFAPVPHTPLDRAPATLGATPTEAHGPLSDASDGFKLSLHGTVVAALTEALCGSRLPLRHVMEIDAGGPVLACRLAEDHLLLLAPSSDGTLLMERLAVLPESASVVRHDVTAAYAGFRLQGSEAASVLGRLTPFDLRTGLPLGSCAETNLASVWALLVRPMAGDELRVYTGCDVAEYVGDRLTRCRNPG